MPNEALRAVSHAAHGEALGAAEQLTAVAGLSAAARMKCGLGECTPVIDAADYIGFEVPSVRVL